VEDHGGELSLSDNTDEERGAEVRIKLPLRRKVQREAQKQGVGDEQERILDRA
jgi:hypothetical protein